MEIRVLQEIMNNDRRDHRLDGWHGGVSLTDSEGLLGI